MVAVVALFVALGGTAVSLPGRNVVSTGDIKPNAVKGKHVAGNALTAKDIAEQTLDAHLVSGVKTKTIRWRAGTDDGTQTILDLRGLRVRATCLGVGSDIESALRIQSTRPNGQAVVSGVHDLLDGDQPFAMTRRLDSPLDLRTANASVTILYRALPKTEIVSAQLALHRLPVFCDAYGLAQGAGLDD